LLRYMITECHDVQQPTNALHGRRR
jgi:hypothetical protein